MLDFAENYSSIVQDAAQGLHWKNSQSTIHHFAIYHIHPKTNKICHRAFACISNYKIDDAVVVYASLGKLLNEHFNNFFPQIEKVIYFGDGLSAQYKTKTKCKFDFSLLDFNLKAVWNSLLPRTERMLAMEYVAQSNAHLPKLIFKSEFLTRFLPNCSCLIL